MNAVIITYNLGNTYIFDINTFLNKHFEFIDLDLIVINLQEANDIGFVQGNIRYKYVKKFQMGQIQTVILSKYDLNPTVTEIGLGPLYFINKGFLIINFKDLMIVNLHLYPHRHNYKRRQKALDHLISILNNFKGLIILAGDFNFRNHIDEAQEFLEKYTDYKEMPITFKETYKYNRIGFNRKRKPAYCDRILINDSFNFAKPEKYGSFNEEIISDHKPVFLKLKIDLMVFQNDNENNELNTSVSETYCTGFYTLIYDHFLLFLICILAILVLLIFVRFIRKVK
ncbi:hypothetical protein NUSPORA_02187 [Nucleospora cyclopteri]